ncbi:MAG TPA: ABC transporter permease [Thermoanaerobaculia bacterium]|nr:ABC transporter permease [Thermoanaerobaculia bacterium]HUM30224.1 ABC transporter permease [Thermoanaerobaculia bacterium]HXK68480.1 ABC transporter permease [Thermoanaerobaculia bacterium]
MNLSNLFVVFKREYLQRVRTVTFWISTIIFPVFMGAIVFIPILIGEKQKAEFKVVIVDPSEIVYPMLKEELDKSRHNIELIKSRTEDTDELKRDVLGKKYNGYLIIPRDVLETGKVQYYGRNVANVIGLSRLETYVNRTVIATRLGERGISREDAGQIIQRVEFDTYKVTEKGEQKDKGASFFMAFLLFLTLYMVIILYGSFILRSVLEEKTTRVVEVLVTTIKPFPLMMGKIIGIAAVGFTQYMIWFVLGAVLFTAVLPGTGMAKEMGTMPITLGQSIYFFVFFILGYFMYAALYAGVGALYNSEQEAQQMATMIVIPLIIPILLMQAIMGDPNGTMSTVLSLIPLFTPLLMYLRILLETPPAWQVALGIGLCVLTVIFLTWISAKVYRVGIFMTGKKPTFKDIGRWIRA